MRLSLFKDPMIAMLAAAVLLALAVPATGTERAVMQDIASVAIFMLFLLNGMKVPRREMPRAIAHWRYFLPLLLFVFGAMALAGLGLTKFAEGLLPASIALGFLYLGVLPSTVQSATSYTTLAGGTVALAVIGAALLNIVGVVAAPALFALLGGGEAASGGSDAIVKIGLILVLPFALGQASQGWTREWIVRHKGQVVWLDRGIIALAVYVAMSGAAEQDLLRRLDGLSWLVLLALVTLYLAIAHVGAWLAGGLIGLNREDRIAFLFGAAQKSVAVGAPLAAILFPPDVAGFVIAPLLLYHLFQLVLAAPLSSWLARHPEMEQR